ncbi:MAG: ABC transporter permease, partial [Micromonosporaceae bacterium]
MAYDGLSERTQRIEEWPETGGEDPTEESRDRLVVHAVWEGLLAVIVVVGTAVVYQITPDTLVGTGLQAFLLFAAALGITAVGAGWSLRAAVPNLAVGPIALAAAVFFGQQSQGGFWYGVVVTLAAATALGVLLGLVVVGLGVPAWAGSLAAILFLGSWLTSAGWVDLPNAIRYDPADHSLYWFLGFMAASVLGGILGALAPVRRAMGAYRLTGDPAARAGFGPSMAGLAALVGSSVLASTGGVLLALMGRGSTADLGIGWTGLAFGAVLLGGTSVYGRIGGVFGTLLAVVLLALGVRFAAETGSDFPMIGHAGVAVLIGLLITRMVER